MGTRGDEHLRVTVTPRFPWLGTPGGKFTIKAGVTTVCTIPVASGKGSCGLAPPETPRRNPDPGRRLPRQPLLHKLDLAKENPEGGEVAGSKMPAVQT